MGKLPDHARNTALRLREAARVAGLEAWASSPLVNKRRGREPRTIAVLAGYGNTSYGDYFIGLGIAKSLTSAGCTPLILGRGDAMQAFEGYRCMTIPDRATGLDTFTESVLDQTDAFILGGGGLFEDRVDAALSQSLAAGYAARAVRAARAGIPVAVHGVGIETRPYAFKGVERLLRRLARHSRTVAVRDSDSLHAVSRFGVNGRQVIDPAVIALSDAAWPTVDRNGVAAFIPFARKAWPDMANPDAAAHARQDPDWEEAAQRLAPYRKVIIAPFHATDTAYTDRIASIIHRANPDTEVEVAPFTPSDPLAVLRVLNQCGSAITMRYHGFMAAYFAGIRDISIIGESQKLTVTDNLNQAGQLGSQWSAAQASADLNMTLGELV